MTLMPQVYPAAFCIQIVTLDVRYLTLVAIYRIIYEDILRMEYYYEKLTENYCANHSGIDYHCQPAMVLFCLRSGFHT